MFLISMAVSVVGMLLAPTPKPPSAKRYELADFSVPTATEDRALPLPFGVVKVAGNVIWHGDLEPEPVTKRVRVSLFKKRDQVIAHKYKMGLWFSIAAAPCDELLEVRLGKHVVWSGSLSLSKTTLTTLDVDSSWTTSAGQEVANGMKGRFVFFNHQVADLASNQHIPLTHPYLEAQLGAGEAPSYPNTFHALWLGPSYNPTGGSDDPASPDFVKRDKPGFISISNNIEPLTFVVRRNADVSAAFPNHRTITYPVAGNLADAPTRDALNAFLSSVQSVEGDANPALVQLELLTTRLAGIGPKLSSYAVDVDSFLQAAQTLKDEGLGTSFAWETSRPLGELMLDVDALTVSVRNTHPATGQIALSLLRPTDDPVYSFNDSNILSIDEYRRMLLTDAPNEIQVPFTDRQSNWIERVSVATNDAGVRAAGSVISKEMTFIGTSRAPQAAYLASREMRSIASSLAVARLTGAVPPTLTLLPGQVVTAEHSGLGQQLRARITSVRKSSGEAVGSVELELIEDTFQNGSADAVVQPVPPPAPPASPPASLTSALLAPAPRALHGDDYDRLLYSALDPDTDTNSYELTLVRNTTTWDADSAEYLDESQEPAIVGALSAALPSLRNASSFTVSLTAAGAQQWRRANRTGIFAIINSEWVQVLSSSLSGTTLTVSQVERGIFDTSPSLHAEGDSVRFLLGFFVDTERVRTAVNASDSLAGVENAVARAQSLGLGGVLLPVNAPASQATWVFDSVAPNAGVGGRAIRPLPPANVRFASQDGALSEADTRETVVRTSTAQLTWVNRNRTSSVPNAYWSAINDAEAGQAVYWALDWETSPGVWTNFGDNSVAVGATTASVSLAPVPAGERGIRLTLRSFRPSGAGVAVSERVRAYFNITA
jgi:hypothetical protein